MYLNPIMSVWISLIDHVSTCLFADFDRSGRRPPAVRQYDRDVHPAVQQRPVRGRQSKHWSAGRNERLPELQGMHAQGWCGCSSVITESKYELVVFFV